VLDDATRETGHAPQVRIAPGCKLGHVEEGGSPMKRVGVTPRTPKQNAEGVCMMETTERALVVSPRIEVAGSRLTIKTSNFDPQELRFALLFWDKLA
jgi:hypothetical protein